MKKILVLLSLASLALMVTFSACKKDEEEVVPDPIPTATIKGKVEAQLDVSNASTDIENAPSGTTIIAIIDASELVDNPVAGYPYKTLTYVGAVDGSGNYSIAVPARGGNVNVTFMCVDFEYDRVENHSVNPPPATETNRKIYSANTGGLTVVEGMIHVVDITYN